MYVSKHARRRLRSRHGLEWTEDDWEMFATACYRQICIFKRSGAKECRISHDGVRAVLKKNGSDISVVTVL